jgi:SDR family mycofactocin-dependent oxidoreductase
MGALEGRVALVTGAARGQGRSHSVRLAEEGAAIIALDLCETPRSVSYPGATREDLAETVAAVEALDRRVVSAVVDVRDLDALKAATAEAVAELGRLDIVCGNAGIWSTVPPAGESQDRADVWQESIDINLTGVWNTLEATVPLILAGGRGGSIVLTSSTAGVRPMQTVGGPDSHSQIGQAAYTVSKHGVVGLMRSYALELAPHHIRVNTVHPTGVATPMIQNQPVEDFFAGYPELAALVTNPIPVDVVEPRDISEAVLFLASDASRYVTGTMLPVDAGYLIS